MSGPTRVIDLERFKFPPQPWYTVHDCFTDYSRERLIAKGKDCLRAWIGFNWFTEIVHPSQDATKITTGQVEDFIDMRMQRAGSLLTPRRELSFVKAAVHNAHRRNRIKEVPYIELPEGVGKWRRPLSEEEFKLVMSKPMTKRLRRFYWVAYFTGHRTEAIHELTWDRVYLDRRFINFNVPGRIVTNKRRCADFPITDEFMARLIAWKASAAPGDNVVISDGPDTYREADHVVRELCGLTDPSLVPRHCMRKLFATELFDRGVDAEIAGHLMADDPKTLRRNYVQFKADTLMEAARQLTRPKQRDVAPA